MTSQNETSAEELMEEIGDELIVYLKAGKLNSDSFIKKLNPDINNFQRLLRIHFLLREDLIRFVKELPHRLRNIKTSIRRIKEFLRGEVRGRINWQDTIKKRCKVNYNDKTLFICQQSNKNFNIKENLVLKELLGVVQNILSKDLTKNQLKYDWLKDWTGNEELVKQLDEIYFRNIYLKRIKHEEIKVTDRMIVDTKKSRNPLYREAAKLLEFYRNFININRWGADEEDEVKELLNKTFVQPKENSVLFELYWIIYLIREYAEDGADFNIIDGSDNKVASWELEGKEYFIYHDSTGPTGLKWEVKLKEVEDLVKKIDDQNSYLARRYKAISKRNELRKDIFVKESEKECQEIYWRGRPDILLEVLDKEGEELDKLIIGEVKYTSNVAYAKKGLEELLEYMALVKKDGGYFNNEAIDCSKIQGRLFLDKIELKNTKVANIEVHSKY